MEGLLIAMAMVLSQVLEVGLNTLLKAATNNGMSNFVFIVYSNALGLCFLVPFSFVSYRKKAPPPISTSIIFKIFVLSLLSCVAQTLMFNGVALSSPTLCSAMQDLVPAFTFIIAIVCRMENLELKLQSSQAKVIGTIILITGALTVTLYKGQAITILPLPQGNLDSGVLLYQQSNWLFGGFLLALGIFCLSILIVYQGRILKDYPAEFMVTTICCGFVVFLSTIVALIAERNPKAWIVRPDTELIAILYSGTIIIPIRNVMYAWAIRKKGPVYVAMFIPLGMIIAIVFGISFLGDALYLGSMIGGGIIGIGFYSVMWGLVEEEKAVNETKKSNEIWNSCAQADAEAPLLRNNV